MHRLHGGYVLDGFPRSVPQAQEARKLAERAARASGSRRLPRDAPDDVLVARLLDRARAQGRTDDTEQVIRHRLRVFDEATAPLLAYYRDEGLAKVIDATATPDEITAAILALVKAS